MKKTAIFCMIAILSLTLMGFGFAKWSDTVYISHSVSTGDVEVGILTVSDYDDGADLNELPGDNSENKDVADTDHDTTNLISTTSYGKNTSLTITNAYPWYKTGAVMELKSLGSVPVKIESITPAGASGAIWNYVVISEYTITVTPGANSPTTPETIVKNTADYTWNDIIADVNKKQLHEGDVLELDFYMHFIEDVDIDDDSELEVMPENVQNATVDFTVVASQWNEVQ